MRLFFFTMLAFLQASCGQSFLNDSEVSMGIKDGFVFEHNAAYLPTASSQMAIAKFSDRKTRIRHAWPFPLLSIGHTMASYQNYGGDPYFHHGLDIRGDAGTTIAAAAGGKVVNIENYIAGDPAYWEVAILDDEGFVWQYHHVDRSSIPTAIFEAYRQGTRIEPGTKIGEIYYWRVTTFGERFHHVHLNILDASGAFLNPFQFLTPLNDTQAPEILTVGLSKNGRVLNGNEVTSNYSVYATIHDLILHKRFVVPAYDVSFRIDQGELINLWRFDRLPGGSSIDRSVKDFYFTPLTCGDYRCRKLSVDLGFMVGGRRAFPSTPGEHEIEVIATDDVGNSTTKRFVYHVK